MTVKEILDLIKIALENKYLIYISSEFYHDKSICIHFSEIYNVDISLLEHNLSIWFNDNSVKGQQLIICQELSEEEEAEFIKLYYKAKRYSRELILSKIRELINKQKPPISVYELDDDDDEKNDD